MVPTDSQTQLLTLINGAQHSLDIEQEERRSGAQATKTGKHRGRHRGRGRIPVRPASRGGHPGTPLSNSAGHAGDLEGDILLGQQAELDHRVHDSL